MLDLRCHGYQQINRQGLKDHFVELFVIKVFIDLVWLICQILILEVVVRDESHELSVIINVC